MFGRQKDSDGSPLIAISILALAVVGLTAIVEKTVDRLLPPKAEKPIAKSPKAA